MDPVPRVNGSLMKMYTSKTVRVVGKVLNIDANQATIETGDGSNVNVAVSNPENYTSTYVEVVGMVTPENGLQEYNSISFGNEFDMSNYNQLVQLANGKYKHLFA